jgi:uncharacterized protein (TIGR02145 family)
MKLKNRFLIYQIGVIGFTLTLTNSCEKDKSDPIIDWQNPADIPHGTILSETQLNATANVPGTFVYTPPAGTIQNVGNNQDLKVVFTPADVENYNSSSKTVQINVTNTPIYNPSITFGSVTDIDGNIYKTVTIGTQTWTAENLRTTHYRNGDSIPTTYPRIRSITGDYPADYQWIYSENNVALYGLLYTWYAVTDSRSICPIGWHIPTDTEWTILSNYLGGESVAGYKLKETSFTHWSNPFLDYSPIPATNETGFTALPGGDRSESGSFQNMGDAGYWWSATDVTVWEAWYRVLSRNSSGISRSSFHKRYGYSVRCIKD